MALIERPADWHLEAQLPEQRDAQTRLSQSWTLMLDGPILRGHQEFPLTKPLSVTAETRRIPEGAELLLGIETEVATECRRCCSPLTVAICEEFMYSYILRAESAETAGDEEEFCESENVIIPVSWLGSSVDISDLVWECLVVSLPDFAECPDGCAGAEQFIPAEDRIDPRFIALADLLEDEEK